jgi:hypothetical protein
MPTKEWLDEWQQQSEQTLHYVRPLIENLELRADRDVHRQCRELLERRAEERLFESRAQDARSAALRAQTLSEISTRSTPTGTSRQAEYRPRRRRGSDQQLDDDPATAFVQRDYSRPRRHGRRHRHRAAEYSEDDPRTGSSRPTDHRPSRRDRNETETDGAVAQSGGTESTYDKLLNKFVGKIVRHWPSKET